MGELSYSDRITSGFFDPGRHSALFASAQSAADMSLQRALDSKFVDFADQREIVLVDFERDVRLRQIQRQARLMLKQQQQQQSQSSSQVRPLAAGTRSIDELQLQVKLLACLVSDSFGGRVVVFSPQQAALGRDSSDADLLHHATASGAAAAAAASSSSPTSASAAVLSPTSLPPSFLSPLSSLSALCHAETSWWRRATNSNCVLLASIQHGLCRHRSLLMKILCDELFAPGDVRCKVVRGFREGGAGHAWTVVNFRGRDEVIVDTLDSPMLFRPLSSLADPSFSYFPQFSESSDSAFAAAHGTHDDGVTNGGGAQQLAFKDLYRATRGRLIGAGAYAEVFECRLPSDAGTSYPLALKVTPTAHLSQAHFSSLLKEIRLLPHLRHPNIVSFLGWLITPRTLNLFLELVVGQNLDITLKTLRSVGQKLRVEDVIVIALEVAKGLRYLHAHATLHRDLKSAQVLIGHPALTEPAPGDKPFSMQLHLNKKAHPERTMFKPKHKFAAPAGAAAAAAASASSSAASSSAVLSSAAGSSILPSPQPGELSFFSSAAIKICDFNIAAACIDPPEESDVDAPHQPVLEYVGTLRWCAPEVYRASAAHTTLGALSSGLPAAAAAAASSGASSSSGASFAPASAAQRLAAGRAGDVWSYANVLLELLTLHLPFEDVPTEPMLNEMLRRGQRSSYQQWLDEAQWKGVTKLSAKTVEEQALRAWKLATAAATAAAPREGEAASSSHTAAGATAAAAAAGSSASSSSTALRLSIYQSLVGLHLQGTMHAPEQRPSMDEIVDALSHMHAQLKEDIVGEANPTSSSLVPRTTLPSVAAAAAPAAAAAAAPVAAPAAPSRLSSKHARDRSSSPTAPARSSRARIEEPQPVPATRI
jgi:serine/threonine protein kinase